MALLGVLVIDEVYCNILDRNRKQVWYFFTQAIFILPYLAYNFTRSIDFPPNLTMYVGLFINFMLVFYLFFVKVERNTINTIRKWLPFLMAILVLFPWLNISLLYKYTDWRNLIIVMLVVNFGMDSGAWFFGKMFGKHKLWPKVSPKKTVEGLAGGALCSGILGGLTWHFLVENVSIQLVLMFSLLGVLSQGGDLIQSKIKREADIKDSSGIIPGHGGVYDRLDSLLFLSPFFVVMINFYYP